MSATAFVPFDPDADIHKTRRRLPHWFQPGRTYFVTFRLADSLPRPKWEALRRKREQWLGRHGLHSSDELPSLPEAARDEFHALFTEKLQTLLDAGYGACVLARPEAARIVADALLFFDGTRCQMDDFIVMPNHVHLLACPMQGHTLSELLQSWKRHSSREINKLLHRTGEALWLDENFDHIVRSEAQLEHYRRYIADNPLQARLKPGTYLHHQSGAGLQPAKPSEQ